MRQGVSDSYILTEVPPVPARVYRFLAGFANFPSRSGYSHIQIGRLAYIFRTDVGPSPSELWRIPAGCRSNALPICRISGWPRAVNAISPAGHLRARLNACSMGKFGWGGVTRPGPLYLGRVAREVQNRWKSPHSLAPPESATSGERLLKFDRSPTSPRTSLQIPRRIFQFSYSPGLLLPTLSECDWGIKELRAFPAILHLCSTSPEAHSKIWTFPWNMHSAGARPTS